MRADACSGYTETGNKSWGTAYGVLRAGKYNLIRLEWPVAEGRGAKNVVTQKARVGVLQQRPVHATHRSVQAMRRSVLRFCPRSVQATHTAAPASFELGEYSPSEELGMHLWSEEGPSAGRRSAKSIT